MPPGPRRVTVHVGGVCPDFGHKKSPLGVNLAG